MIYLYVKTHLITGLKYLGKTKKEPFSYNGSGLDWQKHLKIHGLYIKTDILMICKTNQEINYYGRYFSNLYRITTAVDDYGNRIWANRIIETGGGGELNEESKSKLRQKLKGKKKSPRTEEHSRNLGMSQRGKKKPRTEIHQENLTNSIKENWKTNNERRKQVSELGKSNTGRKQTQETKDKKRAKMKEYWRIKKLQK